MGQTYVEVTGSEIKRMTRADGSQGGTESSGYWLLWNTEGYIGTGWYWDSSLYPNNYLIQGWANAVLNGGGFVDGCSGEEGNAHKNTSESFYYHVTHGHADNLDSVIGGWTNQSKNEFVNHETELYTTACVDWNE